MYDVVIIGGGPAGVSAAIYTKRAGLDVLLLHNNDSKLEKDFFIENYYGFPNGIRSSELFENGLRQVENLGVTVLNEEVVSIDEDDMFIVKTEKKEYKAKNVVLSMGNKVVELKIENVKELEGKGISYCAICDGFLYRNKKICVIGTGAYALEEAKQLKNISNDITILTNGMYIENSEFPVNNKTISKILGDNCVTGVEFTDGMSIEADAIFIALGTLSSMAISKQLGVEAKGNSIVVDDDMMTNIEGLYACGDAIGKPFQIASAVYSGMKAGLSIAKKKEK